LGDGGQPWVRPGVHALHPLEDRVGARRDLELHAPFAVLRALYSTSVGGVASSSGARGSSSNHRGERPDSGGPRAGHGSGASLGNPTCSSIFLATRLSVISAMGFISPPHLSQSNTSIEKGPLHQLWPSKSAVAGARS